MVVAAVRGGACRWTGSGVFDSPSLTVPSSSEVASSALSDPEPSNASSSSPTSEVSSGEEGAGSSSWEDCEAPPLAPDVARSEVAVSEAALEIKGTMVGG